MNRSTRKASARTLPAPHSRHVPARTCVACRTSGAKRDLIRLVRTPEGRIDVDTSGKQPGRGAYLCQNPACWQAALKRRSLERALRLTQLHPDDITKLAHFAQHLEDSTMMG